MLIVTKNGTESTLVHAQMLSQTQSVILFC